MRRLLLLLIAGAASPLRAQMDMPHPMEMNAGPLGIPETRMGSGTSWLPDASPMHAAHYMLGRWTLMLHGKGFLQYDWQSGSRGRDRKSTRLNSSHLVISYAVFCLKKKKIIDIQYVQ